jgi:hypothetical protein
MTVGPRRLLAGVLQLARTRRFRAFEALCGEPRAAQAALLARLIDSHGKTALARRLGVTRGMDVERFRRDVPLTSYEDIRAEIDAAWHGAPDQLAPGHPVFFAVTSGTSGTRKVIPITEDYRRSFQRPMHLFLWSLQRAHPALFDRSVLYMVGPATIEHTPAGVPVGYISGFNYKKMPPLLQRFYAVPPEVFGILDADANAYAVARMALMHDLSFGVAVTTGPLAGLARTLATHEDALLRDIHDGTFLPPGDLPGTVLRGLRSLVRPDPRRARLLRRRARDAGVFAPHALWPHVAALSCWYHAAAGSSLGALREAWRPRAMRSALYSATEGWLNVPLRDGDPSGVAAIDSVFFELEHLRSDGEPTGETVLVDEAEVGARYGIVMTTPVGIWRYRLMDEVRVTGYFGRVPEFHFVQKVGAVLSAHHDLTSAWQFETAVACLGEAVPPLREARWLVWPEVGHGAGRYGFAFGAGATLEASPGRASDTASSVARIGAVLDAALAEANPIYGAERRDGQLAAPAVFLVPPALIEAWDSDRMKKLAAGHQAKPVNLVKDASEIPAAFRATHGEGP